MIPESQAQSPAQAPDVACFSEHLAARLSLASYTTPRDKIRGRLQSGSIPRLTGAWDVRVDRTGKTG